MNFTISILFNAGLLFLFIYLMRKENFLSFFQGGRWWLTWLAIGIITLMDELTSIYYAPYEAFRFIGPKAAIYITITSLLIRFITTRMVEIAEILEVNGLKGGGVYSFSDLVLGPSASFIAVSSILVSYVLTAAISTVAAVNNGTSFFAMNDLVKYGLMFVVVWFITFLNILGIKENAKFTFGVFAFAAFVILNLILGGFYNFDSGALGKLGSSFNDLSSDFTSGNFFKSYSLVIIGIGSCILAYSGIESVLQTASLVKSWKEIRRAYLFLAVTVGIVTPLIAILALTSKIDMTAPNVETTFIPLYASLVNGKFFGLLVSGMASITLIMAVNTAMVASAELIEKFAEKYNYYWIISLNKRQSLYKIHVINAIFYSFILLITSGSQAVLAEMYAVGLIASFCINMFSLLKYRYSKGTKEITYHTSRVGTLLLFIILLSTFIYIIYERQYGTMLWLIVTVIVVLSGLSIYKKRSPEKKRRELTNSPMDIIFAIAESATNKVDLYFRRPREMEIMQDNSNSIYVSFYTPRLEEPQSIVPNHYWLSLQSRMSLIDMIYGLLETLNYEIEPEKEIHLHFGWPLSSWIDRISIGLMIFKLMRMPRKFPRFHFHMDYLANSYKQQKKKIIGN
jgi:amino acid transporter